MNLKYITDASKWCKYPHHYNTLPNINQFKIVDMPIDLNLTKNQLNHLSFFGVIIIHNKPKNIIMKIAKIPLIFFGLYYTKLIVLDLDFDHTLNTYKNIAFNHKIFDMNAEKWNEEEKWLKNDYIGINNIYNNILSTHFSGTSKACNNRSNKISNLLDLL